MRALPMRHHQMLLTSNLCGLRAHSLQEAKLKNGALTWRCWVIVVVLLMTGCGGGGGGGETPAPTVPKQVVSLGVTIDATPLALGASRQLVALARYSDGSSADITAQATWTSSDLEVATLGSTPGRVTAGIDGSTAITASWQSLSATARLLVGAPLVSIQLVSPGKGAVAPNAVIEYAAYGRYANKRERFVTESVTWRSSDPSVASADNSAGHQGDITGIRAGQVSITASLDGIEAVVPLSVLPIRLLGLDQGASGPGATAAAVDPTGRAHAAIANVGSGPLFGTTARVDTWDRDPVTGWLAKALASTASQGGNPTNPVMAAGGPDGAVVLAWSELQGVFAARYAVSTGWQPARTIVSGTTPFGTFGDSLQVAMDQAGNATLAWKDPLSRMVLVSRYAVASEAWSAPVALVGSDGGSANSAIVLSMNGSGQAVLLWQSWDLGASGSWFLRASILDPAGGWSTAVTLHRSAVYTYPDAAISTAGEVIVAGATTFGPGEPPVFAARYAPGSGWSAEETLSLDVDEQPRTAKVAINSSGEAFVVWASGYDSSISARRRTRAGGWEALTKLSAGAAGTADVLRPFITPEGRLLATWLTGGAVVGVRRFLPASGWGPEGIYAQIGHKGVIGEVTFSFNDAGKGTATWLEGYDRYDGTFLRRYYDAFADDSLSF